MKSKKSKQSKRTHKAGFISAKTQTLGSGVAYTTCNGLCKFNVPSGVISVPYVALRTPEFPLYAAMYRWYKIDRIDITFLPHNYIDINGGMFFQLQWRGSTGIEDTDLQTDDTSKYVSLFQPSFKTFSFRPPKALITNFQYTTYDFSSWIPSSTSATNLPIVLQYQITANDIEFEANLQVHIIFRGAQTVQLSRLVNDPAFTIPYEKAVARSEEQKKSDENKTNSEH